MSISAARRQPGLNRRTVPATVELAPGAGRRWPVTEVALAPSRLDNVVRIESVHGMTCQSEIRLPATRRGFTLLELILVLAVLVTITALAVPAVSSMFTGQQLRSAADVVRARLADARVRAIRTGEVYAFFYQPGGSQYWVAPMGSGLQSLQTGASTPSFADELENEIIFSGGDTLQDIRSELAKESMSRQMSGWRPVLCYPDGTSQDAVILLRSKNGLEIQVELRGLTGTASRPLSPQSSEEN